MADEILCTVADRIATVTLNRPAKRNAMSTALLEGLRATFAALEERADVRVVVVRAAGTAFCAGMDLDELSARQSRDADPEALVVEVLGAVERSRHPTIAMVHGDAFAGGCELALHCDLRVVADTARFAMPLQRLGLMLPFPLAHKLVEVVGPAYTRQILLTGQPVDARRAWEIGLVHELAPAAELESRTSALARTIAAGAPLALRGLKATIQRAITLRERIAHDDLDALLREARQSEDAREGVRAMLEKRAPNFRGV